MSDETSGTPDSGDEETVELAREPETIEVDTYPMGEPSMDWRKNELLTYAGANSIEVSSDSTKAEVLGAILGSRINQPDPTQWDDPKKTIPSGARGAVVAELRRRLGLDDGGDKLDARMRARIQRFQRGTGLPVTGQLDPATRRLLM